ncbi:MAG TPA: dTDP-4-dehydrorhamnose 3,5-epimerase [Conexibacter sp.]|nr:dTDP-4-dehydrorhamnose 3,5-epimerase [Conexibacter sp.]
MRTLPTRLDGPLLLEPEVFGDHRGFFAETFRADTWAEAGVDAAFVQDNHSRSRRGTLRGIHFQTHPGQGKLVRCARGRVLDDESMRQLFVPIGFGHGFCVTSEVADVAYKCTSYYDSSTEAGIAYDDPAIGITWPTGIEWIVSERDATAARLADVADALPF